MFTAPNWRLVAAVLMRCALVAVLLRATLGVPRSDPLTRRLIAGDRAVRQHQVEVAISHYQRLLAYRAPSAVVNERLARANVDARRYEAAELYLLAAVDDVGWNADRRHMFRQILAGRGETARANTLWAASDGEASATVESLQTTAERQLAGLQWAKAEATLGQLLALDPGNSQALYQLALLLAPVEPNYAREYLSRLTSDPSLGRRAAAVQAALDAYDTATLTAAHTYLGVTLAGLGEWPFAERALQLAVEINPINPTALAYLGFVQDRQGRDGWLNLEAALGMSPNDPMIHYLLGQHWRLVGDQARELEAFNRAYFLSPDNPALVVEVGIALQNQSDLAGAEEWFRRAVDLDPDNLRWWRVLAGFYADSGFQLEATGLAFIQAAVERAPNDPDLRASLGWAYYQTNDTPRAYAELSESLGLDPNIPRSRYYFGVVLERRGDRPGAADSYNFVVDTLGPAEGYGLLAARALTRLGYTP